MTGRTPRPTKRPTNKERQESWKLLREKWLYTLATIITLGLFVWGVVLQHGTDWNWLAFLLGLFGVGVAVSLDRGNKGDK